MRHFPSSGKPLCWTRGPFHPRPRVWSDFWERLLSPSRLRPHLQLRPWRPLCLVRPGARPQVLLKGALPSHHNHRPLWLLIHVQGREVQLQRELCQRGPSSQVAFYHAFFSVHLSPHRESHHDSTYRSTRVGDSGIPHTSYGHSSSSYDSNRPYKNAVSNYSYNI